MRTHPINIGLGIIGMIAFAASHTIIKDPDIAQFIGEIGTLLTGWGVFKRVGDINPKKKI